MKNNINIIKTKLIMPAPRKNYIKRKHLLEKLNDIADYKVTLIKGIAGSGKTTAVSIYVSENNLQNVNWISLDKENDEIYSFWYYFCESIKEFLSNDKVFDSFKELLTKDSIYNLIGYIVNELSKVDDVFIVLDDFYHIKDKLLNSTIEYLITYSSSNVHYILLTRDNPILCLGQLRAKGQLLEIGPENFKFTQNEVKTFLYDTLKLNIDIDDINIIFEKSEGWITGIQLMALAIKNNTVINISGIDTRNDYLVEYFTEEILNQLTFEEKEFLIKSSILNYFNFEICNEVLNITNSESIIKSLVDKSLFITLVDRQNNIYRYHNVLKQFLNGRFIKLSNEVQKKLYLKAYEVYKINENFEESINNLLQIKEYEQAVSELNSQINNSKGWYYLKQIPVEYLKDYDELIIQRVYYHFSNLQIEECNKVIDSVTIEKLPVLKVFKAINGDRNIDFYELDSMDIDNLKYNNVTQCILYTSILFVLIYKNDYNKVLKYCNKYYAIAKKHNLISLSIFIKGMEATALEDMGELLEALNIYNEIRNIISDNPIISNLIVLYHFGVAGINLKMCEIEKAKSEIEKVESSIVINKSMFAMPILYHEIIIKFLSGEFKETLKLCNELKVKDRLSYGFILGYKIFLDDYTESDLNEYINSYEDGIRNNISYSIPDKIIYSIAVNLYNDSEKGRRLLDDIIEYCRANSIKTYLVDSLIYMILLLSDDLKNSKREVFSYLREAIYYSIDNNYLMPYVLSGDKLLKIIILMKNDESITFTTNERKFVNKLFDIDKIKNNSNKEILSNREKEVLQVLSQGLSNKEIAENLNISLATVKTHIIKIYSKLNVSSRVQAVEKAKKLSLL